MMTEYFVLFSIIRITKFLIKATCPDQRASYQKLVCVPEIVFYVKRPIIKLEKIVICLHCKYQLSLIERLGLDFVLK